MSRGSKIEWTDDTWNPLLGCTKVSRGCDSCYAVMTARIREGNPNPKVAVPYAGLVHRDAAGHLDWTGRINLVPERLDQPLRWRKPRRIFVNSQSDLFHDQVPDEYLDRMFDVMEQATHHTFQILTKRHGRMRSYLRKRMARKREYADKFDHCPTEEMRNSPAAEWARGWAANPPANIWVGVSVEDQETARRRIPVLLDTPAAVRWLSCEPLLGPVDLRPWLWEGQTVRTDYGTGVEYDVHLREELDWVVVGGESGRQARPMHPDWARTLRDQCAEAGIPYLFKQWGEWGPADWKPERLDGETDNAYKARAEALGATHAHTGNPVTVDGEVTFHLYEPSHKPWSVERRPLDAFSLAHQPGIRRWGKKKAGRLLDGQLHDNYPEAVSA